jgi:hypothetical protein
MINITTEIWSDLTSYMSKKESSSVSGQVCPRCTVNLDQIRPLRINRLPSCTKESHFCYAYGTSLPCPREKTEDKVLAEEGKHLLLVTTALLLEVIALLAPSGHWFPPVLCNNSSTPDESNPQIWTTRGWLPLRLSGEGGCASWGRENTWSSARDRGGGVGGRGVGGEKEAAPATLWWMRAGTGQLDLGKK